MHSSHGVLNSASRLQADLEKQLWLLKPRVQEPIDGLPSGEIGNLGVSLIVVTAIIVRILSNPFANVFQKRLTGSGEPAFRVNAITYILLGIFLLPFALLIHWPPTSVRFWVLSFCGGIAGGLGNAFLVKSLEKGELSVMGPINAYKSIIGLITAFILLAELPGLQGVAGIALIIWGSYFVLGTTEEKFTWALLRNRNIQYRIYAMVLTGIEAVFVKNAILLTNANIAFFTWCWWGMCWAVLLWRMWPGQAVPAKRASPGIYVLLVICIGLMQLATNYTLENFPVGYALALFQLSTLVSIVLGYRLFGERSIGKKILGAVIMIVGSLLIIFDAKG